MQNETLLELPTTLIAQGLNGDEEAKRTILELLAEQGISPRTGKPARVMDALDDLQSIFQEEDE